MPHMEGFAIWGAITGSIGAINTVKGWAAELRVFLKESREAGEKLQDFCEQYEMCQANLDLWRGMWGIDRNVSKRYQQELWGPIGTKAVWSSLGSILRTNQDIQEIFRIFLRDAGMLFSPNQNKHQGPEGTDLELNSRRQVTQKEKELTMKKTVLFVLSKSPDLTRKIGFIRAKTTEMTATAKNAFQNKTDVAIAGDFLPKTKLEETKKSILFQLAFETRLASKGLYHSCFAASRRISPTYQEIEDIKLEMDLLRRGIVDTTTATSKEAIALQYQLLVAWPRKTLELSVEGPFSSERGPQMYKEDQGLEGFYGACIKALMDEPDSFQIEGMENPTWFRSCVPPETRRITKPKKASTLQLLVQGENQLKPLKSLLHELSIPRSEEPVDTFPCSERIRLAFKIVECGLFLSGTSWLAGLKSDCIRRSRRVDNATRRFLLDTQASKTDFSDDEFRQFAQQAFAIGVLLVEIGTGRLVDKGRIPRPSKLQGQGFSLYKARSDPPSDPLPFNGAQINHLLVVGIGDEYAGSVKICLESKESWRQAVKHTAEQRAEVYHKVLADYYSEVYLPLKALRDRIEWEMTSKLLKQASDSIS